MTSTALPPDLPEVVERHGRVVAAGDQDAVLADFRSDRLALLVASASLPDNLVSSEVVGLEPEGGGFFRAFIRYTAADGAQITLRSRWVRTEDGWRVHHVRNVPASPPRPGIAGPAPADLDRPHWEGLLVGELRIQRCVACGTWIWAPRAMCPSCHGMDFAWPAVDPVGSVYSWTRTWQPFAPDVSGHLPYLVVLVELPAAGGRRVLGLASEGDVDEVAIGQPATGVFEAPPDDDGWPLLRWRLS
jgi:hypothetical protein